VDPIGVGQRAYPYSIRVDAQEQLTQRWIGRDDRLKRQRAVAFAVKVERVDVVMPDQPSYRQARR